MLHTTSGDWEIVEGRGDFDYEIHTTGWTGHRIKVALVVSEGNAEFFVKAKPLIKRLVKYIEELEGRQ